MKTNTRISQSAALAALLILLAPSDVHAYLDPGTGSIILQAVLAVVFGSILTLKIAWQRIVAFFKGSRAAPMPSDEKNRAD